MRLPKRARPGIFLKYASTYMAILALSLALMGIFYAVAAKAIRDAVDRVASQQLLAGARVVDRRLSDLTRAAARLAIDYEVNFYLTKEGSYTPIEAYDLGKIGDKLSSFCSGNDLLAHLFLYFSGSDYLASDVGVSPYASFYGPMLSVEGQDAEAFREGVLLGAGGERRVSGVAASVGGRAIDCALAVYPIGYGAYRRGAIVGMIDQASLVRILSEIPEGFGGWIAVYDGSGTIVATTDRAREAERRALEPAPATGSDRGGAAAAGLVATTRMARGTYRVYRAASSVADWTYVAALDESKVLAGPRLVMWTAVAVLAACFIAGTAVSYFFAKRNARPVDRLIRLIIGDAAEGKRDATSVFQRVEEAIVGLEDDNRRLAVELRSATELARTNFLQALLAGSYRDRARLAADAARFGVELGDRLVMVAGLGYAGPSSAQAGEDFTAAVGAAAAALGRGEYLVPTSPGEAAFVLLGAPPERRREVAEALRSACPPAFRGALSFGAGSRVDDPFLLPLSFSQAESARSRAARSGSVDVLAYGDAEGGGPACAYPLDLEEAITRAVRSANADLLGSLLASIGPRGDRSAPGDPEAERALASGLRVTALRLFAEFPKESAGLAARLDRAMPPSRREEVEAISALLAELARAREGAKRSHNRSLAEDIRSFIAERYADSQLGLSMVAERFRLSENYLSNLYKEQAGQCVSETIEEVRIAAARAMIGETDESLDRIAAATGYASGASFRRAFKRVVGVAPSEYRGEAAREKA